MPEWRNEDCSKLCLVYLFGKEEELQELLLDSSWKNNKLGFGLKFNRHPRCCLPGPFSGGRHWSCQPSKERRYGQATFEERKVWCGANWRWHPGSPEQLSTFRGLDEHHVPGIGRRTYFYHLLFYPRLQDMIVFVYFFHELWIKYTNDVWIRPWWIWWFRLMGDYPRKLFCKGFLTTNLNNWP